MEQRKRARITAVQAGRERARRRRHPRTRLTPEIGRPTAAATVIMTGDPCFLLRLLAVVLSIFTLNESDERERARRDRVPAVTRNCAQPRVSFHSRMMQRCR
ncbi:hypothetical protein EVAR_27920_1 [Eumeta japonica]|uniref:Uncharacterized protein n=1 Tax=Eumeta variegata TaxID=151549 RepID=A0A4C1UWB4_EUMVA|nr:hypothetical protein EVAR_27920_1 [Eumeta japonica]